MRKEWFDRLKQYDPQADVIYTHDLRPYVYDKTLLYGYTSARESFHVYIKNEQIYIVVYEVEYPVIFEEGFAGFTYGEPRPKNMRQIKLISNRDYIPDKRLYPERCDYNFCKLLKEKGLELSFTNWNEEVSPNKNGYYGFTLEDADESA